MKNKYIYPNGKELLTIINGKVCEGTIVSVRLWYNAEFQDSEAVSYKFKHKDEFYVLPITQEFFASDENMKEGKPHKPNASANQIHRIANGSYTFSNGKAEEWIWQEHIEEWEVESGSTKLIKGEIPEKLYQTKDDAYFFNELVIHKDNGAIEIQRGLGKDLELTEEQKAVMEKLKAVLKEVNDADILLVNDREDESWYAINVSSVDVEFDYDYNDCIRRYPVGSKLNFTPFTYVYDGDGMLITPKKKGNQ